VGAFLCFIDAVRSVRFMRSGFAKMSGTFCTIRRMHEVAAPWTALSASRRLTQKSRSLDSVVLHILLISETRTVRFMRSGKMMKAIEGSNKNFS